MPDGSATQRRRMVRDQLEARGISDPRVLEAMRTVPRESFVHAEHARNAYEDRPLPIGAGQTISQPYTVAFMAEALRLRPDDRVLEVGCGSGYSAAILGSIARKVDSIERLPDLATLAEASLDQAGIENVDVHVGDGSRGLPERAPYDAIAVTAGAAGLPLELVEQLTEGGRIVIPLGTEPDRQTLYRFTKRTGTLIVEALGPFSFVPLVGARGWGAG